MNTPKCLQIWWVDGNPMASEPRPTGRTPSCHADGRCCFWLLFPLLAMALITINCFYRRRVEDRWGGGGLASSPEWPVSASAPPGGHCVGPRLAIIGVFHSRRFCSHRCLPPALTHGGQGGTLGVKRGALNQRVDCSALVLLTLWCRCSHSRSPASRVLERVWNDLQAEIQTSPRLVLQTNISPPTPEGIMTDSSGIAK